MTDQTKPPKSGGFPRSPKRVHGINWLRKRSRNGRSWQERKMRSHRYCPPTSARRA